MPARTFSAFRRFPGQRTCCRTLPPRLPACSRRRAVRRRDAGDPRRPSPHGPPPATSRPSETWERPEPGLKSPAARPWPPKSPAQAAPPRKHRGRATGRSAEGSRRPPERSRVRTGRTRPTGSGAIRAFSQHGIADAQPRHEHRQYGGRRSRGRAEQQPELAEPRHLEDQRAHPREEQQPRHGRQALPVARADRPAGTVPIFVAGRHKNGTVPFGPAQRPADATLEFG